MSIVYVMPERRALSGCPGRRGWIGRASSRPPPGSPCSQSSCARPTCAQEIRWSKSEKKTVHPLYVKSSYLDLKMSEPRRETREFRTKNTKHELKIILSLKYLIKLNQVLYVKLKYNIYDTKMQLYRKEKKKIVLALKADI